LVTVNAPDLTIKPDTLFPVIQVYPWRLHLERTETGLWGNMMWDHPHAHGPDLWRIAILQSPLLPTIDEEATKRACLANVDAMRNALISAATLPDSSGESQALDVGEYIYTELDGQGVVIAWHKIAYIGAYITVDVQQLRRPASG
jgi:hypothetical protein